MSSAIASLSENSPTIFCRIVSWSLEPQTARRNTISADDFVQNEYQIEDIEKAILEHASGAVIKNAIVYPED